MRHWSLRTQNSLQLTSSSQEIISNSLPPLKAACIRPSLQAQHPVQSLADSFKFFSQFIYDWSIDWLIIDWLRWSISMTVCLSNIFENNPRNFPLFRPCLLLSYSAPVSPRSQPIGNIVGADAGRQARERAEPRGSKDRLGCLISPIFKIFSRTVKCFERGFLPVICFSCFFLLFSSQFVCHVGPFWSFRLDKTVFRPLTTREKAEKAQREIEDRLKRLLYLQSGVACFNEW